jgi:SAM-dependent methyltransferase
VKVRSSGPVPSGNVYDKYASRNPFERALVGRFLSALDASLPARPPAQVLDLGAGEGVVSRRVLQRFPAASVIGVDLARPAGPAPWPEGGWQAVLADVARLPFVAAGAELVLAVELLEHVADPRPVLAEIARVAAGRVVLSVPKEPVWRAGNVLRGRYLSRLGNTPGHLHHWSRREFTALVSGHLRIVEVRSPLPWTVVVADARP